MSFLPPSNEAGASSAPASATSASAAAAPVFSGLKFFVRGYPLEVTMLIRANGGIVLESQEGANFVATPDPALVMERAVQDGQSVVTSEWLHDGVANGKLSSKPRTYQPAIEVLAAEMKHAASASASSVHAVSSSVFRGWTFSISQSFTLLETDTILQTIKRHGGAVGLLSTPQVHHLVVRSIHDPPCDAAFDRTRHSSVQPNWIEQCTTTGKLSWDRDCILPNFSWMHLTEHPAADDAGKVPVKFAERWWAEHKMEQPPRDLTADFARIRLEEKQAAAAAAAAAALARSASEEAAAADGKPVATSVDDPMSISSSALSTSRETDYHLQELVPCAEASVPGILRLFFRDPIIGPALGLPHFSIPLLDLITDYLQWRRPRSGTRGYQFMRFWNPKRALNHFSDLGAAEDPQRPLCRRFRSVFPFNSKGTRSMPTNSESPDDLYHHLAVAGLAVVGWAAPLNVIEPGDSYKKLWARLGEVHQDELRSEDYAQLEKMGALGEQGPIVDEDGHVLWDPAAPPPDDTSLMPIPACCIPGVSVVGDYAVTLSSRLPGSYRYSLQLLKGGVMYYVFVLITSVAGEFRDPAMQYMDFEGTSIAEAIKAFESRFSSISAILTGEGQTKPMSWKDRDVIRKNAADAATAAAAFSPTASTEPRDMLVITDPMLRKSGNELYSAQYAEFCLRTFVEAAPIAPALPPPDAEENLRAKYAHVFSNTIEPQQQAFSFSASAFGTGGPAWQNAQPPQQQPLSSDELLILGAHAKRYLRRVQRAFRDAPDVVASFLQIIADADSKADDLDGVIARVRSLFTTTPHLLRDFALYLPESKRIVLDDAEQQRLDTQTQEPDSEDDDEDDDDGAEQAGWGSEEFSDSDNDEEKQQEKETLDTAAEKPAEVAAAAAEAAVAPAAASSASSSVPSAPDAAVALPYERRLPLSAVDLLSFTLARAAEGADFTIPPFSEQLLTAEQYAREIAATHNVKSHFEPQLQSDNPVAIISFVTPSATSVSDVDEAVRQTRQIMEQHKQTKEADTGAAPASGLDASRVQFHRSVLLSLADRTSLSGPADLMDALRSLADRTGAQLNCPIANIASHGNANIPVGFSANSKRAVDKSVRELAAMLQPTPKAHTLGDASGSLANPRPSFPSHCCRRLFRFSLDSRACALLSPFAPVLNVLMELTQVHDVAIDVRSQPAASGVSLLPVSVPAAPSGVGLLRVSVRADRAFKARAYIEAVQSQIPEKLTVTRKIVRKPSNRADEATTAQSETASAVAASTPPSEASAATKESDSSASASGSAATEAASSSAVAVPAPASASSAASASVARARPVYTPECRTCVSRLLRMASEVVTARKARTHTTGRIGAPEAVAPNPFAAGFGAAPAPLAFNFGPTTHAATAPAFGLPAAPAPAGFGFGAPAAAGGAFTAVPAIPAVAAAAAALDPASAAPTTSVANRFGFGHATPVSSNHTTAGFGYAASKTGFTARKSAKEANKKFHAPSHAQVLTELGAQFGAAAAATPASNPFGFGAAQPTNNPFGFGAAAPAEATAGAATAAPSFGSSSPVKKSKTSETAATSTPTAAAAPTDSGSSPAAAALAQPGSI